VDIAEARATALVVALAAALPHGILLPVVWEQELAVPLV